MTTSTILTFTFACLCGISGGLMLGYAIARVEANGAWAILGVVLIVVMMGALKRVVDVDPS